MNKSSGMKKHSAGFQFLLTRIISEAAKKDEARTEIMLKKLNITSANGLILKRLDAITNEELIESKLRECLTAIMFEQGTYTVYYYCALINDTFQELGYEKPFIRKQKGSDYEINFIADGKPCDLLIKKAMKELNDLKAEPCNPENKQRLGCCLKLLKISGIKDIEAKLSEWIQNEEKYNNVNILFGFLGLSLPFVLIDNVWYKNY